MTNTMKSFACFVMGIALTAIVVPVAPIRYAMAQEKSLKARHWCDEEKLTVEFIPEIIYCDESRGDCNSYWQRRYFAEGKCVHGGTDCLTDCYEWKGREYLELPAKFVPHGNGIYLTYVQLGQAGAGGLVCFLPGAVIGSILAGGLVGTYGGGAIASVVCADGYEYFLNTPLPLCSFGECKRDFTKPRGVPGDPITRCE